jgi:hypothetical protein
MSAPQIRTTPARKAQADDRYFLSSLAITQQEPAAMTYRPNDTLDPAQSWHFEFVSFTVHRVGWIVEHGAIRECLRQMIAGTEAFQVGLRS